jgi:hypothetical protein
MNGIVRRPAVQGVILAALLWLVAFVCYLAPGAAAGDASGRNTLFLALCAAVGFGLSLLVLVALARAIRLRGGARPALALAAVATALLVHAVVDTVTYEMLVRSRIVLGPRAWLTGEELLFLNNVLLLAPVHVTYAIAVLLGYSLRAVSERERRLSAALAAAQEAQLAALRFQINPHFLFNSLNAVSSLVATGRNRDAEIVVDRLAAFFRASLGRAPTALAPLSEEFDTVGAYLEIEAARFGRRLAVELEMPRELAGALVPHFLLQPLAENAVKHAVAHSKVPVKVAISASAQRGELLIEVRDDGAARPRGAEPPGAGVGLRNVAARLSALYGDDGRLDAAPLDRGFAACVRLPLNLAAEAAE